MSEFNHWYTKEDYEKLEAKKDREIRELKKKITAIKDLIEGVEPVRESRINELTPSRLLDMQYRLGQARTANGGSGNIFNGLFG